MLTSLVSKAAAAFAVMTSVGFLRLVCVWLLGAQLGPEFS